MIARLENWIITVTGGPSPPHQVSKLRLHGTLVNDGRLSQSRDDALEGKEITTTWLVSLDLKAGTARTKNTLYKLGNPAPEYVEWVMKHEPDRYKDLVGIEQKAL